MGKYFCFFFSFPSSKAYKSIKLLLIEMATSWFLLYWFFQHQTKTVSILASPLLVCNLVWVTLIQSLCFLSCRDVGPFLAALERRAEMPCNKVPGPVLTVHTRAVALSITVIVIVPSGMLRRLQSYFLKQFMELPCVLVIWKAEFSFQNDLLMT